MSDDSAVTDQQLPADPFTIPQAFKMLGYEPIPDDTWAAGKAMQKAFESVTGKLPVKALRPKTGGGGSHCFALYPPHWWPEARKIVKVIASQRARQSSLF